MISRAWVLVLVVGAGCSKALPPTKSDGGLGGGAGGGGPRTGCLEDSQCPSGMVCEGCATGAFSCVPGCRTDSQCKKNFLCRGPVVCAQCPCPPGWCESDPCLDLDNDGYVQSCDKTVVCPGKQLCDCDDAKASVHPNQGEVCANGIDDNCDGKYEWADPACGHCPGGQGQCSTTFSCNAMGTLYCSNACCTQCPSLAPPQCAAGKCLASGGVNPSTGCHNAATCVDCNVCPTNVAQVCGVNGSTYGNSCLAQVANVLVLHDGACLAGENFSCDLFPVGSTEGCGMSGAMYCRDACPSCGAKQNRCTKRGVCTNDLDCPAGQASLKCTDGGVALERCVDHACVADCT